MKPSFRTFALLLPLLGSIATWSPALAQESVSAETLFTRGVERMNAGNYESGCKDIAESHRLDPQPGALFTLATCMDRWGHIATAVALYKDYLSVYEKLPDERKPKQVERPKVARERLEKLGPDVPVLTLTLPPDAPAGTLVKRNGQEIPAASLGVALPVDPGEVVVTTQAPNGPAQEQRITIGKGEKKALTLEVKTAPPTVEPPPKVEPPKAEPPKVEPPKVEPPPAVAEGMSGRRKAAFAIGGVGIAGLVVGAVTGGLTLGKADIIKQHCGEAIGASKARCDPMGLEAGKSAQTLGLASTIGFAAGAVGLAAGVVLYVTDRPPASPKAGARGLWIAAEVQPAGDGAMLGARGAF